MIRRLYCQLAALLLAFEAARLQARPLVEVAARLRARARLLLRATVRADADRIAAAQSCSARATRWLSRLGSGEDSPMTRALISWALLERSGAAVLHLGVSPASSEDGARVDSVLRDRVWITVAGRVLAGGPSGTEVQGFRELWSSEDL